MVVDKKGVTRKKNFSNATMSMKSNFLGLTFVQKNNSVC